MKKLVYVLAWLLLLTNFAWVILASFHFVNTKDGFQVLGKTQMSLVDTFADTRNWTHQDLEAHPLLTARLISAHRQAILDDIRARAEIHPPVVEQAQPLPPLPPLPEPTARPQPPSDPHSSSIFDEGINKP